MKPAHGFSDGALVSFGAHVLETRRIVDPVLAVDFHCLAVRSVSSKHANALLILAWCHALRHAVEQNRCHLRRAGNVFPHAAQTRAGAFCWGLCFMLRNMDWIALQCNTILYDHLAHI